MERSQHQLNSPSQDCWSINDFFKKSIKLLKENPKLLLLSLALMVLATSGTGSVGGFNSGGSSGPRNEQQEEAQNLREIIFNDTNESFESTQSSLNLDEMTDYLDDEVDESTQDQAELEVIFSTLGINKTPEEIEESLASARKSITIIGKSFITGVNKLSPWMKGFFPLGALLLGIVLVLFSVVVGFWIKIAMMCGIDQAASIGNNQWKLVDVTKKAARRIKPMIWMSIIPLLKIILWSLVLFIGLALFTSGIAMLFNNRAVIGIVFFGGGLALLFYSTKKVITLSIAQILGYWNIAINDPQPAKNAFEQSLVLLKQKGSVGKIISLAFVHLIVFNLIMPLIALLPLGAAGFSLAGKLFKVAQQEALTSEPNVAKIIDVVVQTFSTEWILVIVGAGLLTALLFFAISLISIPLKHGNWYWAYQYLINNKTPEYQ